MRVITTACPRVAGLMSITVMVRSSESITSPGIFPATTSQKMQSPCGSATRARLIGQAGQRRSAAALCCTRRMPVDNQLYDRLADTWWNDDSVLSLLRTSINPARFGYMRRVLTEGARHRPAAARPRWTSGPAAACWQRSSPGSGAA